MTRRRRRRTSSAVIVEAVCGSDRDVKKVIDSLDKTGTEAQAAQRRAPARRMNTSKEDGETDLDMSKQLKDNSQRFREIREVPWNRITRGVTPEKPDHSGGLGPTLYQARTDYVAAFGYSAEGVL